MLPAPAPAAGRSRRRRLRVGQAELLLVPAQGQRERRAGGQDQVVDVAGVRVASTLTIEFVGHTGVPLVSAVNSRALRASHTLGVVTVISGAVRSGTASSRSS